MLYVVFLSLIPTERWRSARSFYITSSSEGLLTAAAVIALIIAVILLFWLFARYRHFEHNLNLKITELSINNVKLQQENDDLKATNEKLQQENTKLSLKKNRSPKKNSKRQNTNEVNTHVKSSKKLKSSVLD